MFNGEDYVGLELSVAEKLLTERGYAVKSTISDGGKIDEFDSVLVTRAVLNDKTVELSATKCLLKI